jgi:hypothetical protein
MKINKDDKRTCIGFFYMTKKTWEFGEVKCNVWTGPKGVIVWDGKEWSMYSEWKNVVLIDERISGS